MEEILPSDQAKFTYSLCGKVFDKQIKPIEDKEKNKKKTLELKN